MCYESFFHFDIRESLAKVSGKECLGIVRDVGIGRKGRGNEVGGG
jgi:hypothetical protein